MTACQKPEIKYSRGTKIELSVIYDLKTSFNFSNVDITMSFFKTVSMSFILLTSLLTSTPGLCDDAKHFTILLDPGHDYKSIGTKSSTGVGEYKFNHRFTNELSDELKRQGYSIMLTHTEEETSSLSDRVKFRDYALFISIHHDSIDPEYCITMTKDNVCTTYSGYGYSLWVSPENSHYRSSLTLAKLIGEELTASKFIHSVHHVMVTQREVIDRRTGIFSFPECYVLRHNTKPAILIEIAVITNPIDENNANDPKFRKDFIKNIVEGVNRYVNEQHRNNQSPRQSEKLSQKKNKRQEMKF